VATSGIDTRSQQGERRESTKTMSGKTTRLGDLLRLLDVHLLLDLVDVDAGHVGVVAVDDLGELLEGRALGLDVHEVHKDELEEDPALRGNGLAAEAETRREEPGDLRCR
jgi:hypothetical protein